MFLVCPIQPFVFQVEKQALLEGPQKLKNRWSSLPSQGPHTLSSCWSRTSLLGNPSPSPQEVIQPSILPQVQQQVIQPSFPKSNSRWSILLTSSPTTGDPAFLSQIQQYVIQSSFPKSNNRWSSHPSPSPTTVDSAFSLQAQQQVIQSSSPSPVTGDPVIFPKSSNRWSSHLPQVQ